MRNYLTRLIVAIVTFLLGIGLTSLWLSFNKPNTEKNTTSANSKLPKETLDLSDVFYDFELVNKSKCDDAAIRNHNMQPLTTPSHFETGYCYTFHYPLYVDNDSLFEGLQTRLRTKDIKINRASGDIYRYIGGLVFHIEFQSGDYVGVITNQLDSNMVRNRKIWNYWSVDDYILEIRESKISD